MSQTAIRRAEVEKHIRAVLLSSPVGLTIQELRRDYNDFIGSPLPFRSFGYHDLEDYITDIPEILTVKWQDGKKVLRATADETTRHIEKLVSRQKVSNKNKWAVLRQKSNRPSYRSRYAPAPSVPVSIRQQIRQMFRHTKSLPLTHFDGFFYKRFGFHLDHEGLGFSTVKSLLESIPDTVTLVNQYGEWRVLSAHRKVTPAKSSNPSSPAKNSQPLTTTSTKPTSGRYDLPPPLTTPEKPKNDITPPVSPIKSYPVTPNSKSVSPPVDDTNYLGSSPEQDDYIDPIHQQLKQVLSSKPGIQASRLAFEFKSIIGKDLPFKDHGYHSVIEYVSDLPAIVRIERPNPSGDWLLYDATAPISPSEKTQHIKKSIPPYTGGRRVLEDVKEAISQVLQLHQPDGITMSKFPRAFQDYTGRTIDPCSMGFASFESMLLSLTDDVLQATYKGRECVILSAKNTDEPRRFDQLLQKFQPHATPVPPHVQSYQEKIGLPEDCVLPRTYYTYQNLPEVTGEYIEVFISNIVSPGLFWLQLRGRRTTEALETLMDELSDFYMTSDSKRYKMPDCLYMIGQVCAVIFPEDNNWHRGIITGVKSMEIVEVYFVDYGNTCSVQKDTIRLLKTKFRRLPAQAIQARLANIKPVNEGWCLASRDRMLAICTNKPLVGFLTAVKNRVLSLCLTDTSQLEDIHLNDLLVEEKYAVFAPDELHPSTLGPTQFAEVPGDDILYGITNPSNNTPAVTDTITLTTNTEDNLSSSNPISPPDLPPGPRYVKTIDATEDHMFHLINLYGESYLLSAEISALFWHKDLLSSELIKKDVTCTKVKVIRSDNNDLFQELIAYGVNSVDSNKQALTLYALNELPKILDLFNHPSRELKSAILDIIQSFDPEDGYWKGDEEQEEDFDLSAKIAQELEDSNLGLEELQLTLKAIHFKRKRILEEMMSHNGSSVELVNQLAEVEVQISMTTEVIEEVEKLAIESEVELLEDFSSPESELPITEEQFEDPEQSPEEISQQNVKTNRVAPMVVNPKNTESQTLSLSQASDIPAHPAAQSHVPVGPTQTNYAAANQDTVNMMQQQQQQQQYLLQSMMASQMNPAMNNMMSQTMQYQQMMPNPMLSHWGYLGAGDMATDPQNCMFWPGMNMPNVGLNSSMNMPNAGLNASMNMGMADLASQQQNYQQQMNFLRTPNPAFRLPGTVDYPGGMQVPNSMNTQRFPTPQYGANIPNVGLAGRLPFPGTIPPQPAGYNMLNQPRLGNVATTNMGGDSLNNSGILPSLLPLLHNLNLGRGKTKDTQPQ